MRTIPTDSTNQDQLQLALISYKKQTTSNISNLVKFKPDKINV